MLSHVRLALVATLATLAFASAAASGDPFSISPAAGITAAALGALTFSISIVNIRCPVTLVGSINRGTLQTATGAQIGHVTRPTSGCGEVVFLAASLPWEVKVASTRGSLPDAVTGLTLQVANLSFEATTLGVRCLFRGAVEASVPLSPATDAPQPYAMGLLALTGNRVPLLRGDALCPSEAAVTGTLALSPAQQARIEGGTWRPENPYDFGACEVNRTCTVEIEFINGDIEDIFVEELEFRSPYSISGLALEETIRRRETKRIRLSFTPTAVQPYISSFTIESSGGRRYVLNIRGSGR